MRWRIAFRVLSRATPAAGALLLLLAVAAQAEPTVVDMHVISRDAKFIGSSVGGALVTIEDAATGSVLAQGPTKGETGDTELIMRKPRERGIELVTEDSARFTAQLDLAVPTRVRVRAHGPVDYPDSAQSISATGWLLPGQTLTGASAWILEMPGLIVDIESLSPAIANLERGASTVTLRVHVAMMCNCPITEDGLWPASDFHIEAALTRDGETVSRRPMRHAGEDSKFVVELEVPEPGSYEVVVSAAQRGTGNAGLDRAAIGAL